MPLKTYFLSGLLLCCSWLAGCANTELPRPQLPTADNLPFVHRIDIQQGNVVTQDMIAQLQLGMDKKKVNFVMGSPIIQDTFHANRWDYLYVNSVAGNRAKRRRITLYFEDDKLARVDGDIKPAEGKLVVDTRQDLTVDVPNIERENLLGKIADTIPFVGADEETKAKAKKPKGAARVVPTNDDLPPAPVAVAKVDTLTPIERAAREEQPGPGVLSKLKDAMPFVGDEVTDGEAVTSGKSTKARADAEDENEDDVVEGEVDAAEAEDAEPVENKSDASPGLLAKLKSAMPFSGEDEVTDQSDEVDAEISRATESSTNERDAPIEAEPEGAASVDESVDEEPAAAAAENVESSEDFDARERDYDRRYFGDDEEEEPETVVVAPPIAPTGIPLQNKLEADSPRGVIDQQARARDGEVTVPANARKKEKRGFFARLFSRDEDAHDTEPDNRERKRYRDLDDEED